MKKGKIIGIVIAVLVVLGIIGACFDDDSTNKSSSDTSSITSSQSVATDSTDGSKTSGKATDKKDTSKSNSGSKSNTEKHEAVGNNYKIDVAGIPAYSGAAYTVLNNNVPVFSSNELTTTGYEKYSSLDSHGRCGVALASCGKDTMPKSGEERGSISSIKPSGWVQAKYDGISGGYLWNRCHLIGWQLSAENANKKNLITGTRYMNTEGMLPFENMVADYIKETNHHVAYRVTPIYSGNNLVCSGVQMEAYSVEDNGAGICFNVYCYNIQPNITINYATGSSSSSSTPAVTPPKETQQQQQTQSSTNKVTVPQAETGENLVWVPVNGGTKYHTRSNCSNMKDPIQVSESTAKANGYEPCKRCH